MAKPETWSDIHRAAVDAGMDDASACYQADRAMESEEASFSIVQGECVEVMRGLSAASIDLTVTSPPYDDMRTYDGFVFDFPAVAAQLHRVTKPGGVVVWIVGDATVKGSETGTSFRQALHFKELGFNLHDTMIWNKGGFTAVGSLVTRYAPVFEYMFVLSKGVPKTFNPIKDRPNKGAGRVIVGTNRLANGSVKPMTSNGNIVPEFGQRFNVWEMSGEMSRKPGAHPAPFPEALARDHILSWSNPGDTVLDPFLGSGTTAIVARKTGRNFIGCDVSAEYVAMSKARLGNVLQTELI